MAEREEGTLSCFVLRSMVESYEAAGTDRRRRCRGETVAWTDEAQRSRKSA